MEKVESLPFITISLLFSIFPVLLFFCSSNLDTKRVETSSRFRKSVRNQKFKVPLNNQTVTFKHLMAWASYIQNTENLHHAYNGMSHFDLTISFKTMKANRFKSWSRWSIIYRDWSPWRHPSWRQLIICNKRRRYVSIRGL